MTTSYSSLVLEHFRHPLNRGRLENANATAEGSNPLCGDRIRIECEVIDERVARVAFTGDACAICIAAASVLLDRAKGWTVRAVSAIGDREIVAWLDGPVPAPRRRCATLSLETLQRALAPFVSVAAVRPVILAAGAGSRFGGDKLRALVDGEPMLRGVVRAYAALCGYVAVVARASDEFHEILDGLPVSIVVNDHADEGIASSIRAGVSACSDRPALMIALADEPRVDRAVVTAVLELWEESSAPIVAPRFSGVVGHPVLFDRRCFLDLLALDGDHGARELIRSMATDVRYVDFDQPPPVDIDTPEDLRTL